MARPAGSQNKDKPFRDALRMELAAAGADHKRLREIAKNLIDLAVKSDGLGAIKEIADRLDGKVAQTIENGEDGAFQVVQRIERVIVDPKNRDG
jgi:hypothetical protein